MAEPLRRPMARCFPVSAYAVHDLSELPIAFVSAFVDPTSDIGSQVGSSSISF